MRGGHPPRNFGIKWVRREIAALAKITIDARGKQAGLFWSQSGAEKILAHRCLNASRRLDEFWKHPLNQPAKRNDALSLRA